MQGCPLHLFIYCTILWDAFLCIFFHYEEPRDQCLKKNKKTKNNKTTYTHTKP